MYQYNCKILKVVNSDTVDVDIDLGFGLWLKKERVRINGIDVPESRTRDKEEKKFGLISKNRVKELLSLGSIQVLKIESDRNGEDKKGKFGRILGDFLLTKHLGITGRLIENVSDVLIDENMAVRSYGQSKKDITEEHIKNRKKLIARGYVEEFYSIN
jgi:micrococcal nuclease